MPTAISLVEYRRSAALFQTLLLFWLSTQFLKALAFTPERFPKIQSAFHNRHTSKTSLPVASPFRNGAESGINKESRSLPKRSQQTGQNQSRHKKKNRRKDDDGDDDFAWLYWLYCQWHDSPVSTVEKKILNQFLSAARSWKRRNTILGTQRASELVQRYALEFLSGNPHAIVTSTTTVGPSSSSSSSSSSSDESYFVKLLRTGLEAWLCHPSSMSNSSGPYELLDNLQKLAQGPEWDTSRAKLLEKQVQDHRVFVREQLEAKHGKNLSDSFRKSMAALNHNNNKDGQTVEETLVAMQQTVIMLRQLLNPHHKNKAEAVEQLEDLLISTSRLQRELLQSSTWLSVAIPYFEFIHHSLIRGWVNIGEPVRAQEAYWRMQDLLTDTGLRSGRKGTSNNRETQNGNKQPLSPAAMMDDSRLHDIDKANPAIQRIAAIEDDGANLIKRIKVDKEFQWLNWLRTALQSTKVGELNDSTLRSMIPAITMYSKRKSEKDAKRAQELLDRYVDEFLAGNPHVVLTNIIFNRVCDVWAKLGEPKQAESILRRMVELKKEYGDESEDLRNLKPDVYSLSTLIAAWANNRAPDAARNAEQVLQRMETEDLNPNTITYNAVLKALIRSPHIHKAMLAEEIVQRMEQRYESGHTECQPSIRTYQSLISAWSRTRLAGTAQKAEQVLEYLDEKAIEDPELEPNTHCFAAAIHAWAYSMEENKARRAYNILSALRNRYEKQGKQQCRPNVIVYTSVINACACPVLESEREEAFQIAQLTLDELLYNPQYGHPNVLTYVAILRVGATTLPVETERDAFVRSIFAKACEEGYVGHAVIEKFKTAASAELYRELVIDTGVEQADGSLNLPRCWTRHVDKEMLLSKRKRTTNTKNSNNKSKSRSRPEAARLQSIRFLSGTSGSYSKDINDASISFKDGSFH